MKNFENILNFKTDFKGTVYRNIYTIFTSQNLFDDILDPALDTENILQKYENATSGITHDTLKKNRLFDYSQPHPASINNIFLPPYKKGRFGDGNGYGVWYSAIDEKTSIYEAFYHQWKYAQEQFKQFNAKIITVDRKMFACELSSNYMLDFRGQLDFYSQLTSDDYEYCINLGKYVKQIGAEMLITPSARNIGGYCSPVFAPSIIKKEQTIYYLKFYFNRDGTAEIERISKEKETFNFPLNWQEKNQKQQTI